MTDHHWFFVKGVVSLIGLAILLHHMQEADVRTPARKLRYVALMTAAGAVALASVLQFRDPAAVWDTRAWLGSGLASIVAIAAIASVMEDYGITLRRPRPPREDAHREPARRPEAAAEPVPRR